VCVQDIAAIYNFFSFYDRLVHRDRNKERQNRNYFRNKSKFELKAAISIFFVIHSNVKTTIMDQR
jgi:hypothetical protein